VHDGVRESEQSWRGVLPDLKARGLRRPPRPAVGDGAPGVWAALPKVFPKTREQRCWVHKTANELNYLPKRLQAEAKAELPAIGMAETRAEAERAFDLFLETYGAKHPKATDRPREDREALLAFYDFPAEHGKHPRATNPIESTFATVRLRTHKTKGAGSHLACLTMVFKLACSAASHWRLLNGANQRAAVIRGVRFQDGIQCSA
jgi:transposase-like protein